MPSNRSSKRPPTSPSSSASLSVPPRKPPTPERGPSQTPIDQPTHIANGKIYNAAAVIHDGKLVDVYRKIFLPNYSVFDEERYFTSGDQCPVYEIGGARIGVNICEDIWMAEGPTNVQKAAGAQAIININGSPYYRGKRAVREAMLKERASTNGVFLCYVNMVGGQDELVFDGASMILNPRGETIAAGRQFDDDFVVADLDLAEADSAPKTSKMDQKDPQNAIWARSLVTLVTNSTEGQGSPRKTLFETRRATPMLTPL